MIYKLSHQAINRSFILFTTSLLFLTFSCKKEAGEGGTSAITGYVYAKDYNKDNQPKNPPVEYYESEERVYIVYGDNGIYNDDTDTHSDGSYIFRDLRKGIYTVFVYSDDTTGTVASDKVTVEKTVEITDNKQIVTLDNLIIIK